MVVGCGGAWGWVGPVVLGAVGVTQCTTQALALSVAEMTVSRLTGWLLKT